MHLDSCSALSLCQDSRVLTHISSPSSWLSKNNFIAVVFSLLKIICFLCYSCLQNNVFQIIALYFFVLSAFFISYALSFQVRWLSFSSFVVCHCAIFLIFQMQKQPRDFKTCPGCTWTVSPSMDTSATCSLFPRNENELTVGPALGSGLHQAEPGWFGQRQPQKPTKLSMAPIGGFGSWS